MRLPLFRLLATLAVAGGPLQARAELKDFQVARLILHKSKCLVAKLVHTENIDGSWSYHGYCSNETFYPDGIDVICPHPDNNDERTCRILTEPTVFKYLELLKPFGSD